MDLLDIFRKESEHLSWRRLDDNRVMERSSGESIAPNDSYVQVRLAEMYVGRSRTLWRKFSPLVHAFVNYNGEELHSVAGPGELQELGEHNLDRVIVLNVRLAGPIPYTGGELRVITGLYSVAREDAAAALVSTIGALSVFAGPQAAAGAQIVSLVKNGVDSILGLGTTKLRLGVNDTFGGGNPLRSGFHVGIGAAEATVPFQSLWLRDGRLVNGQTLLLAEPYTGNDYFVLQVERLARRADWPGLPGMAEFEAEFKTIIAGEKTRPEKLAELAAVWPRFSETLVNAPQLTRYDAGQIASDVSRDLLERLNAIDSQNPFIETRSWGSESTERRPATDLDFAEVPETASGDREEGEQALERPRLFDGSH